MTTADSDLSKAAGALAAGRIVAMPTDTVYGLAVDPRRAGSTEALFALKGRPQTTALPVLVSEPADASALGELDPRATALVGHYWPGPLTIVVRRLSAAAAFALGGEGATIGLRCPADDTARRLLRSVGPLAVTSANSHGGVPCRTAAEVRHLFGDTVEIVDGGTCDGEPSTVVLLTGDGLRLLRQGAIPLGELEAFTEALVQTPDGDRGAHWPPG